MQKLISILFAFVILLGAATGSPPEVSAAENCNTVWGPFQLCDPDIYHCGWTNDCVYSYGIGNWEYPGPKYMYLRLEPLNVRKYGSNTEIWYFDYDMNANVVCNQWTYPTPGVEYASFYKTGKAYTILSPDDTQATVTISGSVYIYCNSAINGVKNFEFKAHLVTTNEKYIGISAETCPVSYSHKREGWSSTGVFKFTAYSTAITDFRNGYAELGREVIIDATCL